MMRVEKYVNRGDGVYVLAMSEEQALQLAGDSAVCIRSIGDQWEVLDLYDAKSEGIPLEELKQIGIYKGEWPDPEEYAAPM